MLLALILTYLFLYVLPSIIVDFKQILYVRSKLAREPVILEFSDYKKAGLYSIDSLKFSIVSTIYGLGIFSLWFVYGLASLQDLMIFRLDSAFSSAMFFVCFLVINHILLMPLNFYKSMILDKRYGFSRLDSKTYLFDEVKSLIMLVIFGFLAGYVISVLMDFDLWWLGGFVFCVLLIILINGLYPTLIAPIFNKFTPLEDAELEQKISSMMRSVGFSSKGIFVMDASRRDGRLNAYFGGLGKSKRVVLFDTLLGNITTEGILAILGHELGHFKHRDIIKNIFLSSAFLFVIFYTMGHYGVLLVSTLGLDFNFGQLAASFMLLLSIANFWTMPIIGIFSRRSEYRADEFGASLTSPLILANALVKIINENKAFPHVHPLYMIFHYTHPPLLARLKALNYL